MSDASSPRGKEDSGLINLDALMGRGDPEPSPWTAPAPPVASAPAPAPPPVVAPAPATASAPAPVSARRPDDSLDGIASAKPLPVTASVTPPAPVSAAAAPASAAPPPPEEEKRDKRRLFPILLAFAAVAGIAAVAVHPWRTTPTDVVSATPTANANSTSPAKPLDPKPTAAGNEQPAGMDPNALPTADTAPAPTAAKPPVATTTTAAAAPTTKPEAVAKLSEKDLGTMPSGDQGDLAGAMKGAVGAKDAPTEVAKSADNTGANQIRPAAGQVVGAIGAVLPAARACLGPDDTIRSGSMVFASDGSVKQVSLSGGAKSSDDCIKSALSKAKLQPFADDSFTTHVTVRP